MTGDRLLTAAELGEHLGLAAGTILDRFERGDLPGYRLFGRKGGPVRFRADEVETWLESCCRVEAKTAISAVGETPQNGLADPHGSEPLTREVSTPR